MSKLLRIYTEGGLCEIDLEQAQNVQRDIDRSIVAQDVQGNIDTSIVAKFPVNQPYPINQMYIDADGNLVIVSDD